ncbi:HutD family protein [Streptomyces fuscichromogenes]|uniref:HutD family protein n=1 Tax=Streptomyces fuscichromogenes TaxID=1324013 RepID=A0A917XC58_9ACTN|nr:HutD family protein [Streptomyces fuscichromogenes]GGN08256.1 hypothetical protein GCM10011578_033060 [Streptomyces fuscichromogenes]
MDGEHRLLVVRAVAGGGGAALRTVRRFRDVSPLPWANGAGETSEFVSFSAGVRLDPETAPWRLSVARLTAAGPFSPLPGVRREFSPVAGAVSLRVDGVLHEVGEREILSFSGASVTELVRLEGPCWAVNLMQQTGQDGEDVHLVSAASPPVGSRVVVAVATEAEPPGLEALDLLGPASARAVLAG